MDQYNDPCHIDLVKLASKYSFPEKLLKANVSKERIEKLASDKFAFPQGRLYPIDTPEETLLSALYFMTKKASFVNEEDIMGKITSSALAHGVEGELLDLLTEIRQNKLYKEATVRDYALKDYGVFPINSPEEVIKSAEAFSSQHKLLNQKDRRQVAQALIKKANYYELDLENSVVSSYCGEKDIDLKKAAEYMLFRAKRTKDLLLKEAMIKVAQGLLVSDLSDTNFEKIAEFIDNYDVAAGIESLVKRGSIPDGYNSIFNKEFIFEKIASVTLAGSKFSIEQFRNLPLEKYSEALGKEFIKAAKDRSGNFNVDQAMNIASTLPLGDAKILSEYLKGM